MSTINIGIIGLGVIAKTHMENLLKFSDVKIKAIYSRSNKSDQIPKYANFYTNYNKMLNSEELDAVLICTPTYTHREITCKCAERGLDIFLEKPMASTITDCITILDSIKDNNIKILVGHVLRFWPTYGSIYYSIQNSELNLGKLQFFQGQRLGTFPWSAWFADEEKSGGVVLDLSIHDIDYALWMMGHPESVTCQGVKINQYGKNIIGEAITEIQFLNNQSAECEASWAKSKDFPFFTYARIVGNLESIEFNGTEIKNSEQFQISNYFRSKDGYLNQMMHFIDVLYDRKKSFAIHPKDAMLSVKVCLAANKSINNKGKKIYIDEIT
ncbi:MAG: Gfo/Idh/MocA family protein [Promethearchaeota archaeon]